MLQRISCPPMKTVLLQGPISLPPLMLYRDFWALHGGWRLESRIKSYPAGEAGGGHNSTLQPSIKCSQISTLERRQPCRYVCSIEVQSFRQSGNTESPFSNDAVRHYKIIHAQPQYINKATINNNSNSISFAWIDHCLHLSTVTRYQLFDQTRVDILYNKPMIFYRTADTMLQFIYSYTLYIHIMQ